MVDEAILGGTANLRRAEIATGTALPDGGAVTTTRQAAETGADGLLSDPAVAFFLGGLFMIAVFGVWWYWQS